MRCLGRHKSRGVDAPPRCGRLMAVGDSKEACRGSRVGATDGQGGGTPGLLVRRRVRTVACSRRGTGHDGGGVDARHLGQSLAVLRGRMGAIRSLRFSRDGFAAAERRRISSTCMTSSRDRRVANLDHFGGGGTSRSPQTRGPSWGWRSTYGSVLEYQRTRRGNAAGWCELARTPTRPRQTRAIR